MHCFPQGICIQACHQPLNLSLTLIKAEYWDQADGERSIVHCTLRTRPGAHCTRSTFARCSPTAAQCAVHSAHCSARRLLNAVHTSQSARCTLHVAQCTSCGF